MSYEDSEMREPPFAPERGGDDKDARLWASLCHFSAFALFVLPSFGQIVGPLIVWLIKKNVFPLVDDQGKEVLNFQISVTIYALLCVPLCCVMIGFVLLGALLIFSIVMTIIGGVKASKGIAYRYPLCIRFIK